MPYELTFSQESMFWYLSLFAKASIFDKQDSKEMSPTLHTLYVTVGSYEEQLGILVVQEAWILHGILEWHTKWHSSIYLSHSNLLSDFEAGFMQD